MGFTTTTESPRRQDRSRFLRPAHAAPVVPGHAHNSGFRHRQSPTCSLPATLDPAGVKRRDIGPAVGDRLPEESARMEFSRTTAPLPVVASTLLTLPRLFLPLTRQSANVGRRQTRGVLTKMGAQCWPEVHG